MEVVVETLSARLTLTEDARSVVPHLVAEFWVVQHSKVCDLLHMHAASQRVSTKGAILVPTILKEALGYLSAYSLMRVRTGAVTAGTVGEVSLRGRLKWRPCRVLNTTRWLHRL